MTILSPVQIANMALSNIGTRDSIDSLQEKSVEAKTARLWYDVSRRRTLEAYDWSFARKRIAPAFHEEDPPPDWRFRYQYPSDCLKIRDIYNPNSYAYLEYYPDLHRPDAVPFSIEMSSDGQTKTLLTDMENLILIYTFDLIDTSHFSDTFAVALSYALASDMALKLTGKLNIQQDMLTKWRVMLSMAAANDANENRTRKPRDADWIRGRA